MNPGTVLYLPIAADAKGATVTVQSSGANGVKLTLDGDDIAVGSAVVVNAKETRYVPLAVSSVDPSQPGSFYLTSISVDYGSNEPATSNRTVTVGHGSQYKYQSIQKALDSNDSSLTDRLVLQIAPGDYREKVTVTKPGVVFENGDKTASQPVVIHEAYYAAMGTVTPQANPKYDASRAAGTNTSGTVSVQSGADGFTAYGITFRNDFNISVHPEAGSQTPAVALYTAADRISLVNCRLIGRQDTVWFNGNGRVNVENSYIEGTVDFVFGSADAYIHDTQLHMAHFAGKDNGYFTAPNTNKAHTGLVFDKCRFTADAANTKVTLGRPWQTEVKQIKNAAGVITGYDFSKQEGADGQGVYPQGASSATTLLESTVASNVGAKVSGTKTVTRWSTWGRKLDGKNLDVTYHPAVRFAEYNSTDENGAAAPSYDYDAKLNGDNTKRTDFLIGHGTTLNAEQLTAKRAELLAAMHIGDGLGDWNPSFSYVGEGMAVTPSTTPSTPGNSGSTGTNVSTGAASGDGNGRNGDSLARTGVDVIAIVGTMLMIAAAGAVMAYRRMLKR
ncbi:pectin esterase [Bifidobacterium primatium]|uniref:Pectinesterase n=1 Tax=Bifidobacterium primatium TaxID=2045438 RepID=A0A2M9HC05_9BIFI|nr:pectin esterase [Bifidobacterium primatium]